MAADALLKKIDALDGPLGRRLSDVSGNVDYGGMVRAPETQQRDWLSTLGGGRGINWGAAATSGGGRTAGWLESIKSGGGLPWAGMAAGRPVGGNFNLSGFDDLARLRGQREAREAAQLANTGTVGQGTKVTEKGGAASGGGYDSQWGDKFEQYRAYIQKYAAAEGIDPDALAAMLWIETDGDPNAVSHAGARGLGQVMPETWNGLADPGDDPFNPEHSIKNAARYFAQQYRQYGSYENAAAAYLGGPGGVVNGRPNPNNNDGPGGVGGNSSASYAAIFNRNLGAIKSSAPKTAGGNAPVNAQGTAFPVQGYQGQVQLHWGEDPGAADLFAPAGTPIAAMRGGKVTSAGWSDIGGWNVTIQGTDGLTYYYAHLQNQPNVRAGQDIASGAIFGAVGDTGNAKGTGAHLHLGIGYGIQSGTGPRGGSGINFNATQYLQQVLGLVPQGGAGGNSGQYTP